MGEGALEKAGQWKRGLPRGRYYEGMLDDYEVYFSPGGMKWHRRRTEEEKAAYVAQTAARLEP